jgi:hypothetical protein
MKKLKIILSVAFVVILSIAYSNDTKASPCNDCDGVVSTTYCGTILWYQYCGYNIPNTQRCALECKDGCESCEKIVVIQ